MTRDEFLKFLENFPGRKELEETGEPNREDFAEYDFVALARTLKKVRWKLFPGKEEELWVKLLVFLDLVNYRCACETFPHFYLELQDIVSKEIVRKYSQEITDKFNDFLEENGNGGICLDPEGMLMGELASFLKAGERLFDL